MILKKPYGFLIKHFKIINLILLIPTLYITISISNIAKFYSDYSNSNFATMETSLSSKYITMWLLATIVFMIIVNIFIYILMNNKKKPKKFYTFSIVYYFLLLILCFLLHNNLSAIELGTSSQSTSKLFKDITTYATIPGYLISAITIFKGIGFNIKTLKFDQNIDLQVTDEDEEEIEIGGNGTRIDYKRIFIHTYRELKYYIIENKFVMCCIIVLVLILLSFRVYINFEVKNKKVGINENFVLNDLIISVNDSYLTNTDQGGNIISKNKYFIAVKMKIENNSDSPVKIEKKNFRINLNGDLSM